MNQILILSADLSLLNRLAPAMRQAHFEVSCASDITQGLKRLDEAGAGLVIIDELLTMDSWKLCRYIDQVFDAGIILLGSQRSEDVWLGAEDIGFDFYLEKPVSLSELNARARALLRRKEIVRS